MLAIYAFPPSPRGFKALVVANHLGSDYEFRLVNLPQQQQKTPEFTALNPNQRMPVLEEDGFALWESNAIIQYLAAKKSESELLPRDERARADVCRWLFWELTTWDPACAILVFERFVKGMFGMGPADPAEVEKGLQKFHAGAKVLDGHLKGRVFICGTALTVADFSIASSMTMAEPAGFPLENYPKIRRWFAQIASLPAWKKTQAMQAPPAAE